MNEQSRMNRVHWRGVHTHSPENEKRTLTFGGNDIYNASVILLAVRLLFAVAVCLKAVAVVY